MVTIVSAGIILDWMSCLLSFTQENGLVDWDLIFGWYLDGGVHLGIR